MSETDNELSITLYIDAPTDKVWDVLANRQEEWWCPRPWRVEVNEQDKRPGGVCRMTMYGPDGETAPQTGIYLAFEEGRRFVTTDAITLTESGEFQPSGPFMIGIWEIEPEGNGTRYTARARHWNAETMKKHDEMGFVDGWSACARQLAEICEGKAA
ncbi:uncharacterized protein YndB with AHSA1/START domain [Novosphingobium sp. PhB165]|uniref:SRPBCC domain-containing protein n=1 Tax=Novosphingobium sp. PhB165 TaxID=2485105 RepID=UPI001050F61A|nr:SRPBCC domain-containing protein [Novosphingobium sp. PhB165]TCM21839.1 uncharacterized protein YndB with AHSA1/START domain [Novosphingobium sp. PhB165]